MKQLINRMGALFTLDVFLLGILLSRFFKIALSPEYYRYFRYGYIIFLISLIVFTLLSNQEMPSTKEMKKRDKGLWFTLRISTFLLIVCCIFWEIIGKEIFTMSVLVDKLMIVFDIIALVISSLFIILQFYFLKKYW